MAKLFRTILVPHDGSEHADPALRMAADLAIAGGGRLLVLRAIAPFLPFADLGAPDGTAWIPPEDILATELDALEKRVARSLGRRSAPPAECRVVVGDAYGSIMDAAEEADLIVMGTHGRTGIDHLVIGSVAEKVVRHAAVPVLTIRSRPSAGGSASGRRPQRPPIRRRSRGART